MFFLFFFFLLPLDHLLQKYSLDEIFSFLDEIFNTRTSGALWASNQVDRVGFPFKGLRRQILDKFGPLKNKSIGNG